MKSAHDLLSRLSSDDLQKLFHEVAQLVRETTPDSYSTTSDRIKLRYYGLYKHAQEGPCREGAAPSLHQVLARLKFQAWRNCRPLTRAEAIIEYVDLVSMQDDATGKYCRELIQKCASQADVSTEENKGNGVLKLLNMTGGTSVAATATNESPSELPYRLTPEIKGVGNATKECEGLGIFCFCFGLLSSFCISICHMLGIRPLIPRGRLDISYSDIFYAIWQSCMWWKETPYRCEELGRKIRNTWVDEGVVVGLSVRSLLDLYLSMKNFKDGSEVIIAPPISVPGMMRVLGFHNLKIVPIDLSEDDSRWIDVRRIKDAITSKTVAVMIVHPFGMISISSEQLEELRILTDSSKIELWEDCAECFVGLSGKDRFSGFAKADIRFFSFGLIKTSTALAGGVAIFRDLGLRHDVERLQHALPKTQSLREFLCRAVLALLLNVVADSPWRVGTLAKICECIGMEFETVVTRALRGFQTRQHGDQRALEIDLVRQIRKRPSRALLSLMLRRLTQSRNRISTTVQTRIRQCTDMERLLSRTKNIRLLKYGSGLQNTFWTFPIRCDERDLASAKLVSKGFDVVSGASQLCCVSSFSATSCPVAQRLMDTILYVPVASQALHPGDLYRLVDALKSTVGIVGGKEELFPFECLDSNTSGLSVPIMVCTASFLMVLVSMASPFVFFSLIAFVVRSSFIFICFGMILASLYSSMLQHTASTLYLKGSTAFATNCDLIDAATYDTPNPDVDGASGNPIVSQMEILHIPESLSVKSRAQKTIVLTGATGFIGSMLLRDLLFERHKLGIDQIILISRGKKAESAESRIHQMLNKPMFSFLTNEEKQCLVQVLDGDVSRPSAGLSPKDLERITRDTSVSHVFHCAASVGFTQELPAAATANITAALVMQSIAADCGRRAVRFVHVSTAFVHGCCCGSIDSPLPEDLFPLGHFDAAEIYRSMLGTQFYASKAMTELGFTNSYTLSKCVCEHLLVRQRLVDTLILRPSIVGPAAEFPFEGWAGEKPTTIVGGACLHLLNQWNVWYLQHHSVSHIPVDVLSRFAIVKAMEERNDDHPKSEVSSASNGTSDMISRASMVTCSVSEDSSSTSARVSRSSLGYRIFNATWDASFQSDTFTWIDFCVSYLQLGCVLGYFGRGLALLTLLVSTQVVPYLCSRDGMYEWVHNTFVRAPALALLWILESLSFSTTSVDKVLSFLDLPLLFFPFMRRTYHFSSTLVPPTSFDAKRYVFSLAVAAHRFNVERASKGAREAPVYSTMEMYLIGGKKCPRIISDFWMAMSQPRGGTSVRLSAFVVTKILRKVCTAVTVDLLSFRSAVASIKEKEGEEIILVLAPTHRSIFDFILLSYLMFVVPELQLHIPYVIATDDFKLLPFFGWFAERLRAVYIRRGLRQQDPELIVQILKLKRNALCVPGSSLEVFLEGKRSRDRRFVIPKTGVLKCLRQSGGKHVVVPIVINYERLPEQESLCREATDHSKRSGLSLRGLVTWLLDAFMGRIDMGRIHIVASSPLTMNCEAQDDFASFANEIQQHQKEKTVLSGYHLKVSAKLLDLPTDYVMHGMTKLGANLWPGHDEELPPMPTDVSESMSILLQAGHLLAPLFAIERPLWAAWLDPSHSRAGGGSDCRLDPAVVSIYDALLCKFDLAESAVTEAIKVLRGQGFGRPAPSHVLQVAMRFNTRNVPTILITAAVHFHGKEQSYTKREELHSHLQSLEVTDGQERLGFWGFSDSGFVVKSKRASQTVTMTGKRYRCCGQTMAKILPFIETEVGIKLDLRREFSTMSHKWCMDIESDLTAADAAFLSDNFKATFSTMERVRHGTGHSLDDVFVIRKGGLFRIPDAVVWLESEESALKLVQAAQELRWCLIPFGGGTNVSNATRCPEKSVEPRPIISVDMKDMNRILFFNEEDGLAQVEAGITGRDLIHELERRGYTMGHEPDSVEFSTLGGWIATKASGMKRSRYGNIEDIVISTRVVTSKGILWKGSENTEAVTGRVAEAMDVCSFIIGSEGSLGIISSAVIRIWPLPDVRKFDSIVFPCFNDGLRFVHSLSKKGSGNIPASVRLLDNAHFRLGQALRPEESSISGQVHEAFTKLASYFMLGHLHHHTVVCATIGYEGSLDEVKAQEASVKMLSASHGGISLGSKVGKAGYDLTFMIAYLRDFALTYHVMGESFETFVPWSKIDRLIPATKQRIRDEHQNRFLPGLPFIGCRVTQLYHEGVCLYFYLCIGFDGVENASTVYSELEAAARDEILKHGGSLSHHHGIGKKRSTQLSSRMSSAFSRVLRDLKSAVDEENIFGAQNGPFVSQPM